MLFILRVRTVANAVAALAHFHAGPIIASETLLIAKRAIPFVAPIWTLHFVVASLDLVNTSAISTLPLVALTAIRF